MGRLLTTLRVGDVSVITLPNGDTIRVLCTREGRGRASVVLEVPDSIPVRHEKSRTG